MQENPGQTLKNTLEEALQLMEGLKDAAEGRTVDSATAMKRVREKYGLNPVNQDCSDTPPHPQ